MSTHARDNDEQWRRLEDVLGYAFRDRALLVSAMTHSSFANEYQAEDRPDNERLEFLGDAVLDLVVSEYLMSKQPAINEGVLTRLRAEVVALPSLAGQARRVGLGSFLLLGKGEERSGGRDKASLLADALEALFGAVFLDGGYAAARGVILPLFAPLLTDAETDEGQDYKSRLQEFLQASQRALPEYRLVETHGPDHDRSYRVDVWLDGQVRGGGDGRTKKAAEQAAAKSALIALDELP